MNSQNILKYYGSKLDLKLDNSEFYDLELCGVENDYNGELIDYTTAINYDSLIIDSICLGSGYTQPYIFTINENFTGSTCDFMVRRRNEKGWTLDFIFDKTNINWEDGNVFYYLGISGETISNNYLDNNLSFSFTDDGKIKWSAVRYSGYCDTNYTTNSYISTGQTSSITGITNDIFNLTITFDRYNDYYDCDLLNEGGQNDLVTGWTVDNIYGVISGDTEEYEIIETLNEKWSNEQFKRLGVLKFYINGKRVYSLNNWEEVIPSNRASSNEIVQVWGGGTLYSGDLHSGNTLFNLLEFYYYDEPLNFVEVKHNYMTKIQPYYETDLISCVSEVYGYTTMGITTENSDIIVTEDNNILIY
jgi:hypothetical protein